MPQVIEALERDHANIAKLLNLIESEVLAIEVGKTPDYRLLQDVMRYMTQYSDRFHHPKEDLIFAKLLRLDPGVRADVEELIAEHASIALAGREFIVLLHTSGVDSVNARERLGFSGVTYIRALRDHMRKEEKTLFPLARDIFTKKDWHLIDGAMDVIDDPLFDEMSVDDYQRLYKLIVNG